jgi:preprotein translocase subunit SecA
MYKRILIPFTDGRSNPLPVSASIALAVETKGKNIQKDIEQAVSLAIIDDNWKEHLRFMDELKESSQAASFEQKDPLVVYKMEAYNLFEKLVYEINYDTTAYLSKGTLLLPSQGDELKQAKEQKTDFSKVGVSRTAEEERIKKAAANAGRGGLKTQTIKRAEKKVGRNDPCPCGSGKKYKHCHGN